MKSLNSIILSVVTLASLTTKADALDYANVNALFYSIPKYKQIIELNEERWTKKFKDSSRFDFLVKFYSATTRSLSNTKQVHSACFTGDSKAVAAKFFNNNLPVKNFSKVYATESFDGKTLGITMIPSNKKAAKTDSYHFRLNNCLEAGKSQTFTFESQKIVKNFDYDRMPAQFKDEKLPNLPNAAKKLTGFEVLDVLSKDSEKTAKKLKLPRYKLRGDYSKYAVKPTDRPWKNIDIRTQAGKEKFARDTLYFFFKGMADQSPSADQNFISANNKLTNWCEMPWLQVGEAGREAIHGLTKERDIESSTMYPEIDKGANWGIGYYNAVGCKTIGQIWGDQKSQIEKPNFVIPFPDGTMSAKILFSTSPSKFLKDSFELKANVSGPGETFRSIQRLRMIQIDISVKDSAVPGARPQADNWIMTSYYYDPTFTWDFANEFTSPEVKGLMHMRPIGIQSGFDAETSTIFAGSIANSVENVRWDSGKLLNGPGDNRKSSCMGCHGTAGTAYHTQFKMVPGVLDDAMFAASRKSFNLDFSQQLAFAKRNFETQPTAEKDIPAPKAGSLPPTQGVAPPASPRGN